MYHINPFQYFVVCHTKQ
uniref:Uncharacterized protein n=1 Tax=Rhizophora mucronata TaxID=61149 RepID=A0A2P2IUC4_RHIMU